MNASILRCLLFSACLCPALSAAEQLRYVDLVHRLTDMQQLAVLPREGERCLQGSSYDRASRYDTASGKYVDWDANGDGDGFIRKEGDSIVMAEMEGPGCIWRIWSAAPKEGKVRIFLDGQAEPAVDLPFMGYFDGKNEPFTRSALVHSVALGWNNYTPIPFKKSCKIVADPNWGAYYQFVYTVFPAGTEVPTFSRTLSAEERSALDQANGLLARCGPDMLPRSPGEVTVRSTVKAGPGRTSPVARLLGPRAITRVKARLPLPASPADRDLLRQLCLQIRWDGESAPSVWAPLGDFFGTAPGANTYRSLPAGLTDDGWWYANWYMPFARDAVVEVVNDSRRSQRIEFEITQEPLRMPVERLGRFHAKWHRDAFLPAEPERAIDWTMLKTEGRGRFAGVMLHVWNPRGSWWGEGDEKFFVDGEKFPSTIGTGSEDYFGYAWCNPSLFQNAYHNQTISMGNKGHISVNRWHVTDNIPFQQGFEASIEKYFPNQRPTLYASTVFWYLEAGGVDRYTPVQAKERIGYWTDAAGPMGPGVKGAVEGERMHVGRKTGGEVNEQTLESYDGIWSGTSHLWWTQGKPGDRLDLVLPVAKSGRQRLFVQLTKAPDYGVVQLSLDGQKVGGPVDLYGPAVKPSGEIDLGVHELAKGAHTFTLEITGANPAAVKAYMAGLDYVRMQRAK